jgi:hypothetical protein
VTSDIPKEREDSRWHARHARNLWFLSLIGYPIIGIVVVNIAGTWLGGFARVSVGVLVLVGFFLYLKWLYRWLDRIAMQDRAEKREKFRGIYRVKAPPTSKWTWLQENIKIGDYAWEREPWRKDDLIYLHGLEEQWGVVWMAGFRREDVEYVGPKPVSEYDWRGFDYDGRKPTAPYHWGLVKVKNLCPFAISGKNRKVYRWQFPI